MVLDITHFSILCRLWRIDKPIHHKLPQANKPNSSVLLGTTLLTAISPSPVRILGFVRGETHSGILCYCLPSLHLHHSNHTPSLPHVPPVSVEASQGQHLDIVSPETPGSSHLPPDM